MKIGNESMRNDYLGIRLSIVTDFPKNRESYSVWKISHTNKEIRLTGNETEVFAKLHGERGSFVKLKDLEDVLYADDIDGGALSNTVVHFIKRINDKLFGTGIVVESLYGYGYRLVKLHE